MRRGQSFISRLKNVLTRLRSSRVGVRALERQPRFGLEISTARRAQNLGLGSLMTTTSSNKADSIAASVTSQGGEAGTPQYSRQRCSSAAAKMRPSQIGQAAKGKS
jgi:hypothetical protein